MGFPWSFKFKPRDAAVGGIPLRKTSRLALFCRNRTTQTTGLGVTARIFNPETNRTDVLRVIANGSTSGTTFGAETVRRTAVGLFDEGSILTAVAVTADSITDPTQCWVAVLLFDEDDASATAWLCEGYLHGAHIVSWQAGSQTSPQMALADVARDGALYTFQGTVVNGAGGAGNQSLEVTAATGGRFEVLNSRIFNGDTVARVVQVEIDDASGGNILAVYESVNSNAGTTHEQPLGTVASAATSTFGSGIRPIMIAGGNVYRMSVAAVAASQDSAYALLLRVWGGQPTFTLAGASTPTLTTNTSRFEPG